MEAVSSCNRFLGFREKPILSRYALGIVTIAASFHRLLFAYSPAPAKCNDTYGSFPTTQLSCPGSM
jgi:hypothetical protein